MSADAKGSGESTQKADWTGLIVVALLSPVFIGFAYFGKAELGFTTVLVLGMAAIAIKSRWQSRHHTWFWVTVGLLIALHVPALFLVHWPHSDVPTIVFSMPIGIADYLLFSGALRLAQVMFSGTSPDNGDGT